MIPYRLPVSSYRRPRLSRRTIMTGGRDKGGTACATRCSSFYLTSQTSCSCSGKDSSTFWRLLVLMITASTLLRYEADVLRRARGDREFGNHQEEQFCLRIHGCRGKKKGSSHRVSIIYRQLKKLTVFDPHPIIPPAGVLHITEDHRYITKIDLSKGYWQMHVRQHDIPNTVFVTIDCHYIVLRMPIGIMDSEANFTRAVKMLVRGIN
ncbi:hypothetical protein PoB_004862400 [Plakobranchus ocellatus]|uniref:Reverse transcriptase domain-containing protein n=1 Tax=Plakobranchus ocellatus TaxID=259542 RepID=A0AAV4BTJ8_9GAST|nr:hypothetical protein PoB_004862400 [Plakobranchus ocellatus]